MTYADGLGPSYRIFVPAILRHGISGSLGLRAKPNEHVILEIDYDFASIDGTMRVHVIRPTIDLHF
ncbi:MAG: hypothetical protein ABR584_01665 [Candidatus Baltobacteraceae bacterium]